MIQLIAWLGAITGFIAGFGMLFAPVPAEKRKKTRQMGVVYLFIGAFNLALATLILR
jgi:hypothetical protein